MTHDPATLAVDRLTTALRAAMKASVKRDAVGDREIASALMYELAACLAYGAQSLPAALKMVDDCAVVMKEQIRAFATLDEHP